MWLFEFKLESCLPKLFWVLGLGFDFRIPGPESRALRTIRVTGLGSHPYVVSRLLSVRVSPQVSDLGSYFSDMPG